MNKLNSTTFIDNFPNESIFPDKRLLKKAELDFLSKSRFINFISVKGESVFSLSSIWLAFKVLSGLMFAPKMEISTNNTIRNNPKMAGLFVLNLSQTCWLGDRVKSVSFFPSIWVLKIVLKAQL